MNSPSLIIGCTFLVVILAIFAYVIYTLNNNKKKPKPPTTKEMYTSSNNKDVPTVAVFNHLPNHMVRIGIIYNNVEKTLKDNIAAGGTATLLSDDIFDGCFLRFYIRKCKNPKTGCKTSKEILYAERAIVLSKGMGLKKLHIGMITSRYIGDTIIQNQTRPVQGMPFVHVNNMTAIPLNLNDGRIHVDPLGQFNYQGMHHMGVALGTRFEDQDGIYPTFNFDIPATDIYYGIVSDIDQPAFGGYGMQFYDGDFNPMYPAEEGVN